MTSSLIFFYFVAALLIASSLLVVFKRNVVHNAIALVAALFLIAILFLTLHAPMVGVLQVLVYAGAIMVLFLFVIMLLNPTVLEQPRVLWRSFGTLAALALAGVLIVVMNSGESYGDPLVSTEIFGSPETLAKSLFTEFVLPFEIASVLLLVAIVGAVVLAKREH